MRAQVKLLIVAYIFPPLAGAGVYRTLKFVKYLPSQGIEPTVLSAEDDSWYLRDDNGVLARDIPSGTSIVRVKPKPTLQRLQSAYRVLKRLAGRSAEAPATSAAPVVSGAPGLKRRVLDWLGTPDEQVYWVSPAVREGMRLLRESGAQCIYSSAPPFSAHLVALELKRRSGLPLVVDFRDAWAGNPVYMKNLRPARLRRHRDLERRVVEAADVVLCAAPGIADYYRAAYPERAGRVRLLTNGFDPDDFLLDVAPEPSRLVLSHLGELSITRNPEGLLRALAEVVSARPSLPVTCRFIGYRDAQLAPVMDAMIAELGLGAHVEVRPAVPHDEAIGLMKTSDVLVFQSAFKASDSAVGRTYPGKLFEYMAAGRPVLGVVPEGESSRLIDEIGCGWWRDPEDIEGLTSALLEIADRWQSGELRGCGPGIERFNRRQLTAELATVVREVIA